MAEKKQEDVAKKPQQPNNQLAVLKRDFIDKVADRVTAMIEQGELAMPPGFAVGNAIASWWLKLQTVEDKAKRKALDVCTKESVANATFDMLVQGLNCAKNQCYPIVYGDQLVCQRGYVGSMAVVKYIYGQGTQIWAEAVYEGDTLTYEIRRGRKMVKTHEQDIKNVDPDKVVAAYVIIEPEKEGVEPVCEIMTIEQIRRAWRQGQTGGQSPAHKGFPDEMSKKTVINRGCKLLIAAADDSHLVARHARRQDEIAAEAELAAEMAEEANGELLSLEDGEAGGEVIDLEQSHSNLEQEMVEEEEGARPADAPPVASGQAKLDPGF